MFIILLVVLILVFGGVGYGFRGTYANGPYLGGGVGMILLVVVLYLLLGR